MSIGQISAGRRLWVEPRAVIGGALWSLKMPGHTNEEFLQLADKIIDTLKLSGYRIVREQTADGLPPLAEYKIDVNK
jgi:hypothetical protein